MELKRRNLVVYSLLLGAWVLIVGWQIADHVRVRNLSRAELVRRARDVSTTVGTTIRLLRRFGGVVSKERLETALAELLRPGEWDGIALFNEAGDVVASAGTRIDVQPRGTPRPPEVWLRDSVILMNPVALGTNVTHDLEGTNLPVIIDFHRAETNRPPRPTAMSRPEETNTPAAEIADAPQPQPPPPTRSEHRSGWPRFTRPPWWTEEEWKSIQDKQGVHSFAIVMSTRNFQAASKHDLWLRAVIVVFATVSVLGSGLAWGNVAKSAQLQIRLVRASELNTHLKQMNLAAAGLAHETRNPLNIIRGLAQMISKRPDAPPEIRDKSRAIVDETDKVTVQLNEFINYSRPREIRRTVLNLNLIAQEVVRALGYDIEEKKIRTDIRGEPLWIEADEQSLRQALFNLVLNAIQAMNESGEIRILTERNGSNEGAIEIRDNGPGVPADRRTEIFRPYFTTQQQGTGLGLAIVNQIVLAHGWEIECLPNQPRGAVFRITHLKLAAKA